MRIVIRDPRTREIMEALEAVAVGVTDFTDLWRALKPKWYESRREMFASQGASTGARWPGYQVSESTYLAIKGAIVKRPQSNRDLLKFNAGRKPLRLFKSLTTANADSIYDDANPTQLRVGTSVSYAHTQDVGGVAPIRLGGGSFPARPILRLGNGFVRDVAAQLSIFVGELKGARELGIKGSDLTGLPVAGGGRL